MPRQSIRIPCACEHCGIVRFLAPSQVKAGQGRFCSRACMWAPRRLRPHPTDPDALIVPLTRGKEAVIDRADGDRVGAFRWSAMSNGQDWYARRMDARTTQHLYLHRWVLAAPNGLDVDHVDGDTLNNRRSNLRLATRAQNAANRGKQRNNTTGFLGVFRPSGHRRYLAVVRFEGVAHRLGWFETAEDAARAYDLKAREVHGEFAHLNFPDEG